MFSRDDVGIVPYAQISELPQGHLPTWEKDGLAALFLTLHVSGSAAAVVTPAAAAVAVTVPEYEDNDQNNDPPPAVAEGADTGRIIARHNETS